MRAPSISFQSLIILWVASTAGCGGGGLGSSDAAGQPPDLSAGADAGGPDLSSENSACEAALATQWAVSPPTTGIGASKSADSYVQVIGKLMSDFQVPGGAVAVTQNGRLVLAKGLGFSDRENQQPANPDQLFRVASLTKQLTSAAILHLVAAGKLSLDEAAFPIIADLAPLPGKSANFGGS